MADSLTWRPNDEDRKILERLAAKFGLKFSQIIRMALRQLDAEEKEKRA